LTFLKLPLDRYIEQRDIMIKNIRFSSNSFNQEQRNAIFAILMGRHIKVFFAFSLNFKIIFFKDK